MLVVDDADYRSFTMIGNSGDGDDDASIEIDDYRCIMVDWGLTDDNDDSHLAMMVANAGDSDL